MKTFSQSIRSDRFVITADLAASRADTAGSIRQQVRLLKPHVAAVQVPDSHDGRIQMSPTAAAVLLLNEDVDPVVHLTGRDRNRIALENELLGLAVLGVSSVLLTRGEELPASYRPVTRQVFELSGEDLVTSARLMAEDDSIPAVKEFLIGTPATVFVPKKDWKPKSLQTRVDAGAAFIQTQICFNMKSMRRYMQHLVDARLTWKCAVMASLAVLPDAASALELQHVMHGAVMSQKLVKRISQATDPELEGIRICAEKIQQLQEIPGITGVNLSTPGNPELMLAAIEAAGIMPST